MKLRNAASLAMVTACVGLAIAPAAQGTNVGDAEFQAGRAREACQNQAQRQMLTVNRVVDTHTVTGSGGRMIGSDVTLSVSRGGQTYNVLCHYDNASQVGTITVMEDRHGNTATVNASLVTVRVGPAVNYNPAYQLRRGATVTILGERWQGDGVWYRVRPTSGSTLEGWVQGDLLTY